MKPIIVDMKDMSDSTEVYDSRPNRFLIYTIYLILLAVIVAVVWMCVFKIDIVVKSNGMFKGSDTLYEVGSAVTGKVRSCYITDGQYVNEGDVLYVLEIESLSDTIIRYQDELKEAEDRLEMLSAYEKSLDGDEDDLKVCTDNPYYDEFVNKRKLLYANISLNESNNDAQAELYQGSVDSILETIDKYNEKINKLNAVKQCIISRNNTFDSTESYYYSIVVSYLATYNYTSLQYDNQISELKAKIDAYEEEINKGEADTEVLRKQMETVSVSKEASEKEKSQALSNLELQQLATIEQQISGYSDTIISMETSLTSAKLQLESVNSAGNEAKKNVAVLTEKGNIAAEILNYKEKAKECEAYLSSYDIQNNNCTVKAGVSGYYYATQDLKTGAYVQEGTKLGMIYPDEESMYYAEVYVENSDIAMIKEGQEVKFEIAAYPSSEYGYFSGEVENIARDITIDQSTGYAYYKVKVRCDNMSVINENGEEASLKNGMACQAKIVTDEKSVLAYVLEKIDLLD